MGCACSTDDPYQNELVKSELTLENPGAKDCRVSRKSLIHKESVILGKGMTNAHLAVAMLQANKAAAMITTGSPFTNELEYEIAQKIIRKAKNEGCTVSIVNACLYIDYKFVGMLPPEMA
ncbi:unnamed protein product, partial [Mesorhabditis belari]|uniref:Uncharacterized protein n=1 Tax=Mesorhabditis belari TaxID=2138241 RepID=A0AAF3FMX1_9BILA